MSDCAVQAEPAGSRSFQTDLDHHGRVGFQRRRRGADEAAAAWTSEGDLLPNTRKAKEAAYVLADDLFLLDLGASLFERLTRTAEKESRPRLSPDGRRLAFVRGNDLVVVDVAARVEIWGGSGGGMFTLAALTRSKVRLF